MTKNDDDDDDDDDGVPALFARRRAREDALADANRFKLTARPPDANYDGVTERRCRGFMRYLLNRCIAGDARARTLGREAASLDTR